MSPSTEWRERVEDGEEQRFEQAAEAFAAMQREKTAKYGTGRALHRKQLAAMRAELEVLPDLPAHAAQGLFAEPGKHEAWIRLSNGSMDIARDRTPDIRGFAFKVFGVSGESARGGPAKSQDFVLINRSVFGFTRPEPFFGLVLAAAKGVPAVIGHFVKTYGFFAGLSRLRELQAAQSQSFPGFAAATFFSAAPISMGPYAARVRLVPASPQAAARNSDWNADIAERLARGSLVRELQVQFFVDEAKTPIEDGTVDWLESVAPYVTVARLTIPQQDLASEEARAFAEKVERAAFDPWSALAAHRPLGAIMRARKVAYFASQKGRGAA
ncbi:MAG: catalase [Polyangiales bacterium]